MTIIAIAGSGANITTGAASARAAIPNNSAAARARYVRVTCTVAAYIKPGDSTVTAAAADILLLPEHQLLLAVGGFTHIAAIQVAAAGVVNICAIEDGPR